MERQKRGDGNRRDESNWYTVPGKGDLSTFFGLKSLPIPLKRRCLKLLWSRVGPCTSFLMCRQFSILHLSLQTVKKLQNNSVASIGLFHQNLVPAAGYYGQSGSSDLSGQDFRIARRDQHIGVARKHQGWALN